MKVSPTEREIRSHYTAWHHHQRHASAVSLLCNALSTAVAEFYSLSWLREMKSKVNNQLCSSSIH